MKNLEQIVAVYLHFISFRMHERAIATKMNMIVHMAVEYVLFQKSMESAKWTAQVANINKYLSVNAVKPGNSSGRMP